MQTYQHIASATTRKNHIQTCYLLGLFMALFLYINLASALSQKTTCYFEYKKDYYSAKWEAYKAPGKGGTNQAFDVTFDKISDGTPLHLLNSMN